MSLEKCKVIQQCDTTAHLIDGLKEEEEEKEEYYSLSRIPSNSNSHLLLVEMQKSATSLEDSSKVLIKLNITLSYNQWLHS